MCRFVIIEWIETAKDEAQICIKKSNELSLSSIIFIISFFVSDCHNFLFESSRCNNINKLLFFIV
jgi:hypothetical protein